MKYIVVLFLSLISVCAFAQETITVTQAETIVNGTSPVTSCANRQGAATSPSCPEGGPCNGDEEESEGLQAASNDPNGSDVNSEMSTCDNSVVDNVSFNYIHYAWDWKLPTPSLDCGSCGSTLTSKAVPVVELKRYHRFRDVHEHGSFGPGVFHGYDMNLQITTEGSGSKIILFDPNYFWRIQFEDGLYGDVKDGVFYEDLRPEEKARIVDKLTLYDGPLGTGNVTSDLNLAQSAVVRNLHGLLFYFEIIDMGSGDLSGRLVRQENRRGYGVDIAYKTFTPAEIDESPARQFQIDQIADANGRVISFEYHAAQVASKWVVSSATLPNGETVNYNYSGGYLTSIEQPDGTLGTFTFGLNATTNCTTIQFHDTAATGTHRTKTVYLTNNFNFNGGNYGTSVASSSSLLVRIVLNGNNEVSYLNIFAGGAPVIYEGGYQIKKVQTNAYIDYMKANWTLNPNGQTISDIFVGGTFSLNGGSNIIGSIQDYYRNTPQEYVDLNGVIYRMQYDAEGYCIEKKRYVDSAYESRSYNEFKQRTRTRDMEGRVELMTYDVRGNLIQKEVGLLDIAGVDTPQAEYAIYTWEYYPAGHPNQFLKKASIDANGNKKEFIYDSNHFLIQVIEPADNLGDAQAVHNYTYTSSGCLETVADPLGRVNVFEYNTRDRQTTVTYNDGSKEKIIYGAPGSGDENLIVKKVDRNGNIAEFEFDNTGRTIKTTVGNLTMSLAGIEAPVADPTTKVEEICTYLPGTNDKKATCLKAGELTTYTYEGRNRWVTKTVHPEVGKTLTHARTFTNGSLIKDETDVYGRKTIHYYSSSTKFLVKTIKESIPGNVFDYSALYAVYGQQIPNAPYVTTGYSRDLTGLVTQYSDAKTLKTKYIRDSRRRVVEKIEAFGKAEAASTVTVYDANSNVIEVQHPRNFDTTDPEFGKSKTTYTYTGRNLLKTRTEGAGSSAQATESYTYYLDKREKTRTDFNGGIWTTIWHQCCGRLQAKVDPEGNGTLYDVDYAGNVVHTISGSEFPLDASLYVCNNQPVTALNEVTTRFDERNRPTHSTVWLQPLGAISNKGRPSLGNGQIPIAGEDGIPASEGLTTRFVYDDNLTDNIGLDQIYATHLVGLNLGANANGSALEVTNPAGEKSLVIRDGLGRTIKTVDAVGSETQALYDTVVDGLVETAQIIDPQNLALTNKVQTDALGRTLKTIDAQNQVSLNEFDSNGNRLKSRDPNGVGLDCVFDNRNREISCTDTQGSQTTKVYDKNSNVIQEKDALNKTVSYIYDARNRLKSTTNRIGSVVTNNFDGNSNLTSTTDGQGNTTTYIYNVRNLQTERIFADSEDANDKVVFSYDAIRRKISQLDQKGDTISYQFDMANRLTSRNYPDNLNDTFAYDQASRLTEAVSNRYSNTVTKTYNPDATVATEGLVTHGEAYQISHQYDNAKRKTETVYPNGKVLTQDFTDRNQLASLTYDSQSIAIFNYDIGQRETSRLLGNGLIQTTSYQLDNQILQKKVDGIVEFGYTYDLNKRKTSETDGTMPVVNQTFSYDFEDRLTAWTSAGSVLNQSQSWNLSLEGAWIANTVNGITETRTFNAAYEALSSDGNPMSHDRKGNLIQNKDSSNYTWDFDNQLSYAINSINDASAYTYDALGRRVSKDYQDKITIFVHSEYQILSEYTSDNGQPFTEKQSHIFGAYIDDIIAIINTNGIFYAHSNRQFSVGAITNSLGQLEERYAYNAYGSPVEIATSTDVDNPYFFTGRQLDKETGLFYFRARYYYANLGQFISRDPIGYVDGMNLYRGYFVARGVDPMGLECCLPERQAVNLAKAILDMLRDELNKAQGDVNSAQAALALAEANLANASQQMQLLQNGVNTLTAQLNSYNTSLSIANASLETANSIATNLSEQLEGAISGIGVGAGSATALVGMWTQSTNTPRHMVATSLFGASMLSDISNTVDANISSAQLFQELADAQANVGSLQALALSIQADVNSTTQALVDATSQLRSQVDIVTGLTNTVSSAQLTLIGFSAVLVQRQENYENGLDAYVEALTALNLCLSQQ